MSYLCVVAVVTMIDAIATVTFRCQDDKKTFFPKGAFTRAFKPCVFEVYKFALAGAYQCESPFKCNTLGQAFGLTHKLTMKHSNLLQKFVNYRQKSFTTLAQGPKIIKKLSVVYRFS